MIPGHLILSATGVIQAMNEGVASLLRVTADQWIGRSVEELWTESGFSPPPPEGTDTPPTVTGANREQEGVMVSRADSLPPRTLGWRASHLVEGGTLTGFVWLLWEESGPTEGSAQTLVSYRDTFTHAIEGIYRTTMDGRYLEVNPALARMYGYESPTGLIAALADLNTQLYVEPGRRAEFIFQIWVNGYVSNFESQVYRADGSLIWIAEFARTVTDERGKPIYFEGSVIEITRHRQVLATLRESEERFRHLVETMNLVPWEGQLEGRQFSYVGPQAVSLLGWPVERWLREGFWDATVHPEDLGWVRVVQEEALAKSDRFEAEYRMMSADGKVVWVRDMITVGAPLSAAGTPLMGFLLDVTHRRSTEMALEKSSFFLDQLVSAFPVIVYLYDVETMRCVYVSGRVDSILGYTGEALSEMSPLFLLALGHPDETGGFADHVRQTMSAVRGEGIEREVRLRSQNGEWVWLRLRESVFGLVSPGVGAQIVGVATDITARHQAWEELVGSEALFRSLVEDTDAIPFEYDFRSRRLTYIGPQAEEWLGYPLYRWCQEGFWNQVVHPEDAGPAMVFGMANGEDVEDHTELESEGRLRKADGRFVWVKQVLRRIAGEHGRWRARGFLLDITQRKNRELELEMSRSLLREHASRIQTAREQERIGIARELHDELGQALTLVNLDVAWLQLQFTDHAPRPATRAITRKLDEIKQSMEGTSQILRRILTSLRPPVLDELGLAAAIEWQAGEFSRRLGLRCEVDANPIDGPSEMVATAAFRIFQEMLTNIARHAKATSVKVVLSCAQDRLILSVSDNGVGFTVAESDKKQSFGLLGIRERAEALGGTLQMRTSPGRGTTIAVAFPLAGGTLPTESQVSAAPERLGSTND